MNIKGIFLAGAIALLPFTAGAATPAAAPASNYQPIAFLAGHCWKGDFPGDGKQTDQHCFAWVYGDKFVRDQHVVHGGDHPDYLGESIYFWDAAAQRLQYIYFESDGGVSHGGVTAEGDALVFPPTRFTEDGKTSVYRSRWVRAGDDAYDVVTEFQGKDGWVPGFKVHMKKVDAQS